TSGRRPRISRRTSSTATRTAGFQSYSCRMGSTSIRHGSCRISPHSPRAGRRPGVTATSTSMRPDATTRAAACSTTRRSSPLRSRRASCFRGAGPDLAHKRHRAGFVGDRADVALLAEPDPPRPPADVEGESQLVRLQVEDLHQSLTWNGYIGLVVVWRHPDTE